MCYNSVCTFSTILIFPFFEALVVDKFPCRKILVLSNSVFFFFFHFELTFTICLSVDSLLLLCSYTYSKTMQMHNNTGLTTLRIENKKKTRRKKKNQMSYSRSSSEIHTLPVSINNCKQQNDKTKSRGKRKMCAIRN